MEQAETKGLRFSHVLNMGNSIQVGVEDMLELLDVSHNTKSSSIVLLYLEAVNNPQKLLRHATSLVKKGCALIGIKSGVTDAGAKAAASHTGAMTTSDNAVQALFDKAGIIRVKSKMELIETACALVALGGLPKGNQACIITDAGGPGVMLTDELIKHHINLPDFSQTTTAQLKQLLPPQASVSNPIDCLPSRNAEQVKEIFTILGNRESQIIDMAFFLTGNSGMSDNKEIYDAVVEAKTACPIPIIPVFSSATTCEDLLAEVRDKGTLFFQDEVVAGTAIGRIVNRPQLSSEIGTPDNYNRDDIAAALKSSQPFLPPETVCLVLQAAGFNVIPQREVSDSIYLEEACRAVGFPLVMKVIGPVHKSDVGGVRIGIKSESEARQAWGDLANIPGFEGVLLQQMVSGTEIILGATREEPFGHILMFGLGGIYTEVLKDVTFALAPLTPEEAKNMIQSIRSFPILQGVRGQKGVSMEKLVDYLLRLGQLVSDFPEIREIDLNPVKGIETKLYPVDCRIRVD
jgi:acetyltransferase